MYTAYTAIEFYAEAFEQASALDKLEGFSSFYGADFYGLPRNTDSITLTKQEWSIPQTLAFADETLIPLRAGETVTWKSNLDA
jgi:dihydroorotase